MIQKRQETRQQDNFIMLPTVDFCFKELMQNEKVRRGILSALLKVDPQEIEQTKLMPTILRKEHFEDKFGILDVRILMKDGTQIDLEMQVYYFEFWKNRNIFYLAKMFTDQIKEGEGYDTIKRCIHVSILDFIHFPEDKEWYHYISFCDGKTGKQYTDLMGIYVLELKKLPEEVQDEDAMIRWMRFFGGKCREDFEHMAKKDEYIGEAYEVLQRLSADELKRLEYETRQKAIRDYNTQMNSAERRGIQQGIEQGRKQGIEQGRKQGIEQGRRQGAKDERCSIIKKLWGKGTSIEEIADLLDMKAEDIEVLIKESEG